MKAYSFFHAQTGAVAGHVFLTDDKLLVKQNTPDGHVAFEGRLDHLSQRVDVVTRKPVDYQPPAPSNDHEWDAGSRRWKLKSAAQAALDAHRIAHADIVALEASQPRALRENALGVAGARERLQSIEDQIAALRAKL